MNGRMRSCAARIRSGSIAIVGRCYIRSHGPVRKAERDQGGRKSAEDFAFAGRCRSAHAQRSTTREASGGRRTPRDQESRAAGVETKIARRARNNLISFLGKLGASDE